MRDYEIQKNYDKIMEHASAAFLVTINKQGGLEVGVHGVVDLILIAIAGGLIGIRDQTSMSLEDIGEELNKHVDILVKGGYHAPN